MLDAPKVEEVPDAWDVEEVSMPVEGEDEEEDDDEEEEEDLDVDEEEDDDVGCSLICRFCRDKTCKISSVIELFQTFLHSTVITTDSSLG